MGKKIEIIFMIMTLLKLDSFPCIVEVQSSSLFSSILLFTQVQSGFHFFL